MPTTSELLHGLLDPAVLLSGAIYYFTLVLAATIWAQKTLLISLSSVQDAAFSRFWLEFVSPPGPKSERLEGSAALVPGLFASASGDVLHVGPGSGVMVSYFASNDAATAIYGAEPNAGLHAQLDAEIRRAGMGEKYFILAAHADTREIRAALQAQGSALAREGRFDSIVCVRVLCSVPDPEGVVSELYHLLKPGGRLLLLEHVANPWRGQGSILARVMQAGYMLLGWKFFVGGCCLDRDLEGICRRVGAREGGWEKMVFDRFFGWSCLPYLRGELRKQA